MNDIGIPCARFHSLMIQTPFQVSGAKTKSPIVSFVQLIRARVVQKMQSRRADRSSKMKRTVAGRTKAVRMTNNFAIRSGNIFQIKLPASIIANGLLHGLRLPLVDEDRRASVIMCL